MQHDAGLDLAAMDAVPAARSRSNRSSFFVIGDHIALTANIPWSMRNSPADDVDHLRLAAMRVEQDELAAAGARHALADLEPEPE